ncbi:MAG: hypothetical protein HRF52_11000 [Ignavibacterium sp.]|jgi:hypothetical protein|uniref:hypothetical protein n=1 Tax=Ignavibacterium sp. TaxID=2651167 RepID=UPI0032987C47
MKRINIFFVILLSTLFALELFSQTIPQTINFQGVLKDASGNIVSNGDYNVTFKIYNAETGGTELWTETKLVNVVDGIFSTQLGSVTPITLPFDAAYWLGITVGGGSELTPRVAFSSVPYSRMSLTVPDNSLTASKIHSGQIVKSLNGLKDNINLVAGSNVTITPSGNDLTISAAGGGGGTVTQVNTGSGLTGGPITTTGTISIANDGITNAMLQNNSVTSPKIADGTIATNDLSDNSVTSAKIVDGTVSTSDLANNSVTTNKIVDGTITATDIANTQVVKSINSLKDDINLVAGSNITITPSGQNLTISSTSGGIGGSGTTNYLPLFTGSTTLGSSVLYQSGSKIGIGTTTPDYSLTINANPTAGLGLKISRSGGLGMAFIEEGQPVDEKGWEFDVFQKKFSINTTHDNGYSQIKNLMTFDRNGNVGIGTTSPLYPLHVSTNRRYAGYFTSDSLFNLTNVIHAEFTGSGNSDAKAVYGYSVPADFYGYGGYFIGGYMGVEGGVYPTGNHDYYGVYGKVSGGSGNNFGIYGFAYGSGENVGVYGYASGSVNNWAGYFSGNVNVTGTLSKGGGSFKIDHPLDPQNKYLYHSFVESPDMKNIYDGTVITDASGYATVTLPDWFEALNKDFRYQLTVIGDFAQAIVAQEIHNNQFTIRTDKPNVKVSWQVTGIRHDPFAEKNRIPVEEYKKGDDVGKYLYPDAYGLPETMGIDYKHIAREKERGK